MLNRTDEQLMRLVLDKHRPALEELYDRYVKLVFSFAMKATNDEQTARDMVQLVFTRLWTTQRGYVASQGRFVNWLLTITRNLIVDHVRKERKHANTMLLDTLAWEQMVDPMMDLEATVSESLFKEQIEAAYVHLSKSQIALIEQVYWKGYTLRELANLSGEPLGTIKSRLHQTLLILRKHLKYECKEGGMTHG